MSPNERINSREQTERVMNEGTDGENGEAEVVHMDNKILVPVPDRRISAADGSCFFRLRRTQLYRSP